MVSPSGKGSTVINLLFKNSQNVTWDLYQASSETNTLFAEKMEQGFRGFDGRWEMVEEKESGWITECLCRYWMGATLYKGVYKCDWALRGVCGGHENGL